MLPVCRLNGYAVSRGFKSERERLQMILTVPAYQQAELEKWLDTDGSYKGLKKILHTKAAVRRSTEEDA